MLQGIAVNVAAVMPRAIETGLFVSLCTIQQPDGNYGPSGQPSGVYVDVSGLVEIPCMSAVPSDSRIQASVRLWGSPRK